MRGEIKPLTQIFLGALLLFLPLKIARACGPWFPQNMLDRGDDAVLVAPRASFYRELDWFQSTQPRFQAAMPTNGLAEQTLATELQGLRASLSKSAKSTNEVEEIISRHKTEREKLQNFVEAYRKWEQSAPEEWNSEKNIYVRGKPTEPRPKFPEVTVIESLPEEFADYFSGAITWHNPAVADKTIAREAWERILSKPPDERRNKSTWAAFMLGCLHEKENPEKAMEYFQQVTKLAKEGCLDPTGLAVASIGWQARLSLRQNDFARSIGLYLDQYAAGDYTAPESLGVAAARALKSDPQTLSRLAADSRARQVITAYVISSSARREWADPSETDPVKAWLSAVEQANVRDVESAERLALAAYQANEMELAQRWIDRAGDSPTAQWIQAKLFLRDGKIEQAAALLGHLAKDFPTEKPGAKEEKLPLHQELSFYTFEYSSSKWGAGRQLRGEIGALHLTRGEFTQALDVLLNAGFWMDTAYIAERVLTADELKHYVDRFWPPVTDEKLFIKDEHGERHENLEAQRRESIRHLLARRLTRLNRSGESREYFPASLLPQFDAFIQALVTGQDESLPADQRAKALFSAATITRTNGMGLIGTEVEPDWVINGGSFSEGVSWSFRTNLNAKIVPASDEEIRRASEHTAVPERRFHYRYQAASLAWEAAKLMPNNSDETARVLWTGGSWLKAQDPEAADVFYKALVRRNRKTELGAEADCIRWFPKLDENGNVIHRAAKKADSSTENR